MIRIDKAIEQACEALSGLPDIRSKFEAESLLAHLLGESRTWVLTWNDKKLSSEQFQLFQDLIQRRIGGEPFAYLVGYKEFWSLDLQVTPDTLIPRPETELLVELALKQIPKSQHFRIADLGTGTGAIALAIAAERSQATVFAVDFSEKALQVALTNRVRHQLTNVQLVHNSWLDNWPYGNLDLIVSNPPYVEAGDPHLTDLSFEPYQALVAADSGLADIKTICQQARRYLKPQGYLMFEHGFEQGEQVRAIMAQHGFSQLVTYQDLSGNDRVTAGWLQPSQN
ncbi:peptide chain release factor N(5)-glutamine methyltransferase [Kangiella sp. TOML190]|uniref:peptide chain release factor N(5)-glutamine methyltransferase n=1 Tax=Kangiella sp. TOML190 TaxID=2931351 RepID=UPI00203DD98B|nr:peptide chain release factor N(5)-glutamine methyltransferase [Kangiella sp. TOML190]